MATTVNERRIGVAERALTKVQLMQLRPQGFSLKKWVRPHPFFEGKALGTRLQLMVYQRLRNNLYHTKVLRYVQD